MRINLAWQNEIKKILLRVVILLILILTFGIASSLWYGFRHIFSPSHPPGRLNDGLFFNSFPFTGRANDPFRGKFCSLDHTSAMKFIHESLANGGNQRYIDLLLRGGAFLKMTHLNFRSDYFSLSRKNEDNDQESHSGETFDMMERFGLLRVLHTFQDYCNRRGVAGGKARCTCRLVLLLISSLMGTD